MRVFFIILSLALLVDAAQSEEKIDDVLIDDVRYTHIDNHVPVVYLQTGQKYRINEDCSTQKTDWKTLTTTCTWTSAVLGTEAGTKSGVVETEGGLEVTERHDNLTIVFFFGIVSMALALVCIWKGKRAYAHFAALALVASTICFLTIFVASVNNIIVTHQVTAGVAIVSIVFGCLTRRKKLRYILGMLYIVCMAFAGFVY